MKPGIVNIKGKEYQTVALRVSNFRATESLHEYLAKANLMGLTDIDTRALVRHIRVQGAIDRKSVV